jgi:hypothetical protein
MEPPPCTSYIPKIDWVKTVDHPISSAAKAAAIWSRSSSWLGHSSIQTTERYLGSEQEIEIAVNDNLGL